VYLADRSKCNNLVKGRPLGLINVPITMVMYVHGKEIVVQGSTCSGIGAKWHIITLPAIDVPDSLSLTLSMMHVPVVTMHLDNLVNEASQFQRGLLRLLECEVLDSGESVDCSPSCNV
jgi:hypothetical protein